MCIVMVQNRSYDIRKHSGDPIMGRSPERFNIYFSSLSTLAL